MEIILIIAIYLIAFVILWYATGLIFDGTRQLTQLTKLSSFATSFFILGMLTSIPELSVGLNAIVDKQPSIFVGDLLGATLTLFGLVIPLLAIFGHRIKLVHQLSARKLQLAMVIAFLQVIFVFDGTLTQIEAVISIVGYVLLFTAIEKTKDLGEKLHNAISDGKKEGFVNAVKITI